MMSGTTHGERQRTNDYWQGETTMRTIREAISALRHPQASIRAEAASFLATNPTREAEAALVPRLNDSASEVRVAVSYALGQIRSQSPETVEALAKSATHDQDASVRKSCCYALGWNGSTSAKVRVTLFEVLQTEPDIGVRCAAAMALERSGHDAGFEFLKQTLRANDSMTNFEAYNNLGMLGLLTDAWTTDQQIWQLIQTPNGRAKLVQIAETIRGKRSVERISTTEFIRRSVAAGLIELAISLSWEVDEYGNMKKFDFVLMAPVQADFTSPSKPGVVQNVRDMSFNSGPLSRVLGRDDDGSLWFDGPPLETDQTALDSTTRFRHQGGTKTTARRRVAEFFELLERINATGLRFQLIGSGLKPVLAWIEALSPDNA